MTECREQLRKEGKPYPRSNCALCGSLLRPNFKCIKDANETQDSLQTLKKLRWDLQQRADKKLDEVSAIRKKIKELTFEINKLKRELRETSVH